MWLCGSYSKGGSKDRNQCENAGRMYRQQISREESPEHETAVNSIRSRILMRMLNITVETIE